MKKLIFIFSILFLGKADAQITLDTAMTTQFSLGYNFWIAQISETESKYYIGDTITNTFSLYNMDFTPYMTNIPVPAPFMPYYYQVLYITRTLFDCDPSNIEFLYEVVNGPCNSSVFVMRTDGTQLLRVDSARSEYCAGGCLLMSDWVRPVVNTSDKARLFIQHPFCGPGLKNEIYSLCGTLPQPCPCDGGGGSTTGMIDNGNINQSFVQVFPNPSSNSVTFQISPPDNMNDFEIIILDNQSKVVRREKITNGNFKLTIDVKGFSSGNYFYSLCTKDKSYQSGNFIIAK
jgi:hypothetical protein